MQQVQIVHMQHATLEQETCVTAEKLVRINHAWIGVQVYTLLLLHTHALLIPHIRT
jgi:hypothetical protein